MAFWGVWVVLVGIICADVFAAEQSDSGKANPFIPLLEGKPYLHVIHEGRSVKVQRVQDQDHRLDGYFAKTIRKCPPFCIQPISPADGVAVIGEVELFAFMERELRNGSGALIDARTPAWYRKGTIPGSVNYPFTVFDGGVDSPRAVAMLQALGVVPRKETGAVEKLLESFAGEGVSQRGKRWDFSAAKDLVLWCNGPACGQSPRAILGLLDAGYPSERIKYYRGGMQMWQLWGLTTVVPTQ